MKTIRNKLRPGIRAVAFALAALMLAAITYPIVFMGKAQDGQDLAILSNPLLRNEGPFDFNDDFYRKNGIDPDKIFQRVGNPQGDNPDPRAGHWVADAFPTDPSKNNIRIRQITGGWDRNGNLIYYIVPGFLTRDDVFTDDPRTPDIREDVVARNFVEGPDSFNVFLFPKQCVRGPDGRCSYNLNPDQSVAPPNRRQDNIFDTKDRYFCENLLGLWLTNFVIFTQKGIDAWLNPGDPNHRFLKRLADRNGTNLDETPIFQRTAEVVESTDRGLTRIGLNPVGNPPRPRWVI